MGNKIQQLIIFHDRFYHVLIHEDIYECHGNKFINLFSFQYIDCNITVIPYMLYWKLEECVESGWNWDSIIIFIRIYYIPIVFPHHCMFLRSVICILYREKCENA